ncbi:MAG: hypothetical protein ACK452_02425, partial [Bacteroidota bacterium]
MIRSYYFFLKIIIIILISAHGLIKSQIRTDEEPKRLYYERTARIKKFKEMQNMRDVLHLDKLLMGKRRFSGNISFNTGRIIVDNGIRISEEWRSAIAYNVRYRFFEEFCINVTLYNDFNKQAVAPWVGDYSFNFGRYNWKRKKINFGYENFGNHKYNDNLKTFFNKFLEGYFFASYNFQFKKINELIKIDPTSAVRFVAFTRYSVNFRNAKEESLGGLLSGKPVTGFAARYIIFKDIYIESALYLYLPDRKQPWDPDYSYGFGY